MSFDVSLWKETFDAWVRENPDVLARLRQMARDGDVRGAWMEGYSNGRDDGFAAAGDDLMGQE